MKVNFILLVTIKKRFSKSSTKMKVNFILLVTIKKAFFTSTDHRGYKLWSCQNVRDALSYLLNNIYIRFGNKLYRQAVGFYLFLFCYKRDFMTSF